MAKSVFAEPVERIAFTPESEIQDKNGSSPEQHHTAALFAGLQATGTGGLAA